MTTAINESTPEQIRLTAEHKVILEQFKKFGDKHLSSGDLHNFTNIEPIKISAILADLISHGIVHHLDAPNGWLYILSDYGRKFVLEHTEQ